MGYDDLEIVLNMNEEKIDNDEILICIGGTSETIIEKLEATLNEIKRHACL